MLLKTLSPQTSRLCNALLAGEACKWAGWKRTHKATIKSQITIQAVPTLSYLHFSRKPQSLHLCVSKQMILSEHPANDSFRWPAENNQYFLWAGNTELCLDDVIKLPDWRSGTHLVTPSYPLWSGLIAPITSTCQCWKEVAMPDRKWSWILKPRCFISSNRVSHRKRAKAACKMIPQ